MFAAHSVSLGIVRSLPPGKLCLRGPALGRACILADSEHFEPSIRQIAVIGIIHIVVASFADTVRTNSRLKYYFNNAMS